MLPLLLQSFAGLCATSCCLDQETTRLIVAPIMRAAHQSDLVSREQIDQSILVDYSVCFEVEQLVAWALTKDWPIARIWKQTFSLFQVVVCSRLPIPVLTRHRPLTVSKLRLQYTFHLNSVLHFRHHCCRCHYRVHPKVSLPELVASFVASFDFHYLNRAAFERAASLRKVESVWSSAFSEFCGPLLLSPHQLVAQAFFHLKEADCSAAGRGFPSTAAWSLFPPWLLLQLVLSVHRLPHCTQAWVSSCHQPAPLVFVETAANRPRRPSYQQRSIVSVELAPLTNPNPMHQ